MEVSEKLSEKLKAYRTQRGLSLAACSQELGIAKSTLQKLERGGSVSAQTLQYVSNQLGMELSLHVKGGQTDFSRTAEAIEKLIAAAREVQELLEAEGWS